MAKGKREKGQTTIYKTVHRKLKNEKHEPTKTGGESSSCSSSGTRRVTLVTNMVIIHE